MQSSDTDKIVKQVMRYINIEKLIPSHHNVITVACLRTLTELIVSHRTPADLAFLRQFTKYGNFEKVRVVAWSSLLRIAGDTRETWLSLLEFVRDDTTNVRKKVLNEALNTVAKDFALLQREEKFMDTLWELMNGPVSAYDCLLRKVLFDLYRKIYGTTTPPSARERTRAAAPVSASITFEHVPLVEKPQAKKAKPPKPEPPPPVIDAAKSGAAVVKLKLSRPVSTPLVARAAESADTVNRPLRLKLSRPAVPAEADGSPSVELQPNVPAANAPVSPIAPAPASTPLSAAALLGPDEMQVEKTVAPPAPLPADISPALAAAIAAGNNTAPAPPISTPPSTVTTTTSALASSPTTASLSAPSAAASLPPLVLRPPEVAPSQPSGLKIKFTRPAARSEGPPPAPAPPSASDAQPPPPPPPVAAPPPPTPTPLPPPPPEQPVPTPAPPPVVAAPPPAPASVATPPYGTTPMDISQPQPAAQTIAPPSMPSTKISLKRRVKE